jgi:hypothetical protein
MNVCLADLKKYHVEGKDRTKHQKGNEQQIVTQEGYANVTQVTKFGPEKKIWGEARNFPRIALFTDDGFHAVGGTDQRHVSAAVSE